MSQFLQTQRNATPQDPLFLTADGNPMTSAWFSSKLKQLCHLCGLNPEVYTSHSYRISTATTAAPRVPSATLKEMGHWNSAAYERYIRHNAKDIMEGQKKMNL